MALDKARQKDIKELSDGWKNATDNVMRGNIKKALEKIKEEQKDSKITSYRQSLVEARLKMQDGKVRDISESLIDYDKSGRSSRSYAFSFPKGFWGEDK